jgi:hypothetical protein
MLAPGCTVGPLITAYLSKFSLNRETDSGKVSFLAMNTGTPI